jgi:hypothetical protein
MEGNKLNYKKEEVVYFATDDGCYSIRKFDWNRLKRLTLKSDQKKANLPVIYSILYGVSASAGVSIIPLVFADNLPSWVTPLYIIITIFSLGIAILLTNMDKSDNKNKDADLNEIKTEMEEIEKLYNEQV